MKVDGKVRTDATFPCGFMDVIDIPKTDEAFRLLLDTKVSGRGPEYGFCFVKSRAGAVVGGEGG